jgi:hypothetical protein
MSNQRLVSLAAAMLVFTSKVVVSSSARNAPPELAGLKSVWVMVSADRTLNVDAAVLTQEVQARLHKGGLHAENAPGPRTLFVRITSTESGECPGRIYLRVAMSLSEEVRLSRNPSLAGVTARTWEDTDVAVVSAPEAAREASERVLRLAESFADTVEYTTKVHAPSGAKQP